MTKKLGKIEKNIFTLASSGEEDSNFFLLSFFEIRMMRIKKIKERKIFLFEKGS
jgi:hypothetical protein